MGFKVYRDTDEILYGENIAETIADAICNTPIFLSILSSTYMNEAGNLWCQNELDFAKHKNRKLLPVVLKGAIIPDSILLTLGPDHLRIEYDPSEPSTGLEHIAAAVRRMLPIGVCGRCITILS